MCGILHSPTYRTEFASDLKKMLLRIPKVPDPTTFADFAEAGCKLAELHICYETHQPYPLTEQLSAPAGMAEDQLYRITKMSFGKASPTSSNLTKDRSRIVYNSHLTLSDIPDDAYRYLLGSRSAIEWIMDRYQVKTDKTSLYRCGL